jgi:hypothetical protein
VYACHTPLWCQRVRKSPQIQIVADSQTGPAEGTPRASRSCHFMHEQLTRRRELADDATSTAPKTTSTEKHYRISTLADWWGDSTTTIRSWFEDEPSCLIERHSEECHKRKYASMRIPQSVANLVYARHTSR